MGMSHSVYIGPYVRCVVERTTETTWKATCPNGACPNNGREAHEGERYCVMCGTAISQVAEVETVDAVDRWDVSEAISERLRVPGGDGYWRWSQKESVHLWLPNVGWGGRDGYLDMDDFQVFTPTADTPADEMRQFVFFFAPELGVLRERYGNSAVTMAWGVVQYYW